MTVWCWVRDSLMLEDTGATFLWSVRNLSPIGTASHPRRPKFSETMLWEPYILHEYSYVHAAVVCCDCNTVQYNINFFWGHRMKANMVGLIVCSHIFSSVLRQPASSQCVLKLRYCHYHYLCAKSYWTTGGSCGKGWSMVCLSVTSA